MSHLQCSFSHFYAVVSKPFPSAPLNLIAPRPVLAMGSTVDPLGSAHLSELGQVPDHSLDTPYSLDVSGLDF